MINRLKNWVEEYSERVIRQAFSFFKYFHIFLKFNFRKSLILV